MARALTGWTAIIVGALVVFATPPGNAQERWVLMRPPLDEGRLERLSQDPSYLAASVDDQIATVLALAVERGAPMARWQRWVEYGSETACEAGRRQIEANTLRGLQGLARHATPSPEAREAKQRALTEGEVELIRTQYARCVPASSAPR